METNSILKPPLSRSLKSGRVKLNPGEEIGEHITENREELIIILIGKAKVEIEGEILELKEGDAQFISEGVKHNVTNNSEQLLEYIYVVSLFDGKSQ
jgi:quercetin dioxygenase-like cupin family protein